jgi:hypothetical protein
MSGEAAERMAHAMRRETGASHALAVLIEVDDGPTASISAAASQHGRGGMRQQKARQGGLCYISICCLIISERCDNLQLSLDPVDRGLAQASTQRYSHI